MADRLYQTDRAEVWLGSCLEPDNVEQVMGERKADLICLDAPYSDRTHAGHDSQHNERAAGEPGDNRKRAELGLLPARRLLNYEPWGETQVRTFCQSWIPKCDGWVVSITDHALAGIWQCELERVGLYAFAPLPLVETGSRVRMAGDGPSNWTCWIVAARPKGKPFSTWGTLPGAYVQPRELQAGDSASGPTRVVGGKPLSAMLRIIGDYSRRGGLVVDPTCGGGTTLKAALMSGRRAIGMDSMREHADLTVRNIRGAKEQGSLFERRA